MVRAGGLVTEDNIAGGTLLLRATPSEHLSLVGPCRRRAPLARRGRGGRHCGGPGRPIHLHSSRSSSRSRLPRCWFGDGAGAADETRKRLEPILLRWPISDNKRSSSCRSPRGAAPFFPAFKAEADDQDLSFEDWLMHDFHSTYIGFVLRQRPRRRRVGLL
jgi:hypothetical protein